MNMLWSIPALPGIRHGDVSVNVTPEELGEKAGQLELTGLS